jgi:hypothetical protein
MSATYTPDILAQASLAAMTSFEGRPCLSLYQTTHRQHPDNQQDPIRFRHLLKALAKSLRRRHAKDVVKALLEPFEALEQDNDFWNHVQDGMAVLSAPGLFRVFLLQRPVAELAAVSDHFHTKPLRQQLQSPVRYQVLALSQHKVQLFEGDRNALDGVVLASGLPQTMTAALGGGQTESHTTMSSSGGIGDGDTVIRHGQGANKDETEDDAERFFRAVDRVMLEHHSRPSGLPLMLAALPEHHYLFRAVSHNPFLMADGLMVDPQGLTHEDFLQRAWEVAAPQQEAQQAAWSDAYAGDAAHGMGSEDLSQVAHAAVAGRVSTLLIEAERQMAGRIDRSTGRVDSTDLGNPRAEDVLDDLIALVERMGGEVHILPAERMPCLTGLAASFRH